MNELSRSEIRSSLERMGFGRDPISITALGGGVSCDVFAVDFPDKRICVKRALPKLRVAADWRAPPERVQAEVAWLKLVAQIDPNLVPQVIGEDPVCCAFAMEFLPPERHALWKSELATGRVDLEFAAAVGHSLARIHEATAGNEDVARAFDNGEQFDALRIDPYFRATAQRNPDVAETVLEIADKLACSRIALVQGDVSPKNIFCGPRGPVFLDAETASYCDPAFDLAFCLNHLLLKSVWRRRHSDLFARAFAALHAAYFDRAQWESPEGLDARAGRLLATLLLARIDGKSPVEYLTEDAALSFVRGQAKAFLGEASLRPLDIIARWTAALG
ncbi:MAG TPA: aminoglycoside phosphotransferase family protein [Rhizomicrobium sp.]|jgi:5-methylthioribose kinase|nr:aminoglycoside phosphotransferase family protein [Rhizomicrobium sp.]